MTQKAKTGFYTFLIGAFCLTHAVVSHGAATAPKIGVVDMQAVILNVEEGKKARKKLEVQIKAKEKELKASKASLDKMNKEYKTKLALMSEEARIKKQQEFQQKFMAFRQTELEFQGEIKRKEQQVTQQIAVKIAKYVDQLAQTKGLDMVFETNSSGLLYLKNPVNLTKDVVSGYAAFAKGIKKTAKKPKKK